MKKMSHVFYDFHFRMGHLRSEKPDVFDIDDGVLFTVQEYGPAWDFAYIDNLAQLAYRKHH